MVPVLVLVFAIIQNQILHQRFTIYPLPRHFGAPYGVMGLFARHMHNVNRTARHVGNHDGSIRRFAFHFWWTRIGMALGPGHTPRQQVSLQPCNHITILGMHQWQRSQLGTAFEGVVHLVIIHHQRALIGHEMLEGVDAVGFDNRLHFIMDHR